MIILYLTFLIIFCIFLGAFCFMAGHKDGYVDGRLDEKWRKRDEKRNIEPKTNI